MPRTAKPPAGVHQLKVTLTGIRPPIWRRLQVPSDVSLEKLHDILQVAMGWTDSHLHQFKVGGTYYGVPDPDYAVELPMKNEKSFKLSQIAPRAASKLVYEYDFGDSWEHAILVEKILAPEAGTHYPRCLTGRRAAPPEDCGGIWGYAEFLEAIRDPEHEEHEDMIEWIGGPDAFDPEAFDVDQVNAVLRRLK